MTTTNSDPPVITTPQSGIAEERVRELVGIARELATKHFDNIIDIRIIDEEDGDSGEPYSEVNVRVNLAPQEAFDAYRKFLRDWSPQVHGEECRQVRLRYGFKRTNKSQ